jgi:hypothetical protein
MHIVHPDDIVNMGTSIIRGNEICFVCTLSRRIIEYNYGIEKT